MSLVSLDVPYKKMFESNLRLLDCFRVIPLDNCQSELARPVNNHISNIH